MISRFAGPLPGVDRESAYRLSQNEQANMGAVERTTRSDRTDYRAYESLRPSVVCCDD